MRSLALFILGIFSTVVTISQQGYTQEVYPQPTPPPPPIDYDYTTPAEAPTPNPSWIPPITDDTPVIGPLFNYCVDFTINHCVALQSVCYKAVELQYNQCFEETGGDPAVQISPSGRTLRKCAAARNFQNEVCSLMCEIAEVYKEECDKGELIIYPFHPNE